MACYAFLAAAPNDPTPTLFFPRAITPAGNQVYGITTTPKIQVFTWPALTFVSTHASPAASGADVAIDPAGNIYHAANTGGTTVTLYKNGVSLASIVVASGMSGGGVAFADGWLWCVVSTSAGTGSGGLYRVDPSSGAVTTPHSISGGRFGAVVYAATDGAVWYRSQPSGTVYRHLSGSTTSVAVGLASAHFVPRPSGVMMARRSSPAAWVDIDPSLTVAAASCDPTLAAGASPPPSYSFTDPAFTDVAFMDNLNDIYRAEAVAAAGSWWINRIPMT